MKRKLKLSDSDVRWLRHVWFPKVYLKYGHGEMTKIAKEFGVSPTYIADVVYLRRRKSADAE
jgi:hypothetical protein